MRSWEDLKIAEKDVEIAEENLKIAKENVEIARHNDAVKRQNMINRGCTISSENAQVINWLCPVK